MPLSWIGVFVVVVTMSSSVAAIQSGPTWESQTVDGRRALTLGRLDVAESAFSAALASAESTPDDAIRLATSLENLGTLEEQAAVLRELNRAADALPIEERAKAIRAHVVQGDQAR